MANTVNTTNANANSIATFDLTMNQDAVSTRRSLLPQQAYWGNGVDDFWRGRTQSDYAYGRGGNDTMHGRGGNDKLWGGAGDDIIIGGEGNDKIWGGVGEDFILGGLGNDQLSGGSGADTIFGQAGDDIIYGGLENDLMNGGAGLDLLYGGSGADNMTGGTEADRFLYTADSLTGGQFAVNAATGISVSSLAPDAITDFTIAEDRYELDASDLGINGALNFQKGAAGTVSNGNVIVLTTPFANAAAAAKAIADNNTVTNGAGLFVYFNQTLGFSRLVHSQNLAEGGPITVLANMTNQTGNNGINALNTFSTNNFALV